MYLLNHEDTDGTACCIHQFTFHYVSIKSELNGTSVHVEIVFTFHYVSIKSNPMIKIFRHVWYLHSTMYLLNLGIYIPFLKLTKFTFHYVSIKSGENRDMEVIYI